ncbi:MAG: hypothetical protein AAF403_05970, partial [Pseudomonadota bacterium]
MSQNPTQLKQTGEAFESPQAVLPYYFGQIERLMCQKQFTEDDSKLILGFFEFFSNFGFSSVPSHIRIFVKRNFSHFLSMLNLWDGAFLAQNFHGFLRLSAYSSKALMEPLNVELSAYACMPFYMWAKARLIEQNIDRIQFKKGERYIFITKSTNVLHNYSPAKMIYTYCKSFLSSGKQVTIIPYFDKYKGFATLQKKYPHL